MKVLRGISVFGSSLLLAASFAVIPASAAPSQLFVSKKNCSDLGTGTRQTPFCTVQKAVNTAGSGSTITVDSGTYPEQVVINGKDNLTLKGAGNSTVIQMPTAVTTGGAIVDVTNASGLDIDNLKVAGPFTVNSCATEEYGIRLNGNVPNATIERTTVADVRPASDDFFGCQNGIGIQVGRNYLGNVATATLSNVNVSGYAKVGVLVDGTGSNANISNAVITGRGPTPLTALNGVQVSRSATANITKSTIQGHEYTPKTYSASGILLYQAGKVSVTQNVLKQNDVAIDVDTHNSTFSQNTISDSVWNGIYVESTASGNSFTQNTVRDTAGAPASYTSYDVEDDTIGAGTLHTADTWHQNTCKTSSPALLCKQ